MAEFQEVLRQFDRMCRHFRRKLECPMACPMNGVNISQCRKVAFEESKETEKIVMAWASEHPEPEYPTWAKWLEEMGIIQIQWNGPVLASMRIGVDDTEYIPVKTKMLEHIPADIAQKLGMQQK